MKWNGQQVTSQLHAMLAPRVERAGKYLAGYIKGALSTNIGSVVPFVASRPNEYPYYWDGELAKSITYAPGDHPLKAVVFSDAVDQHVHIGHHFSGEEEFGHWWDGWAWDFQTGKIVKVAPAHQVAPRPFMRRGLAECHDQIFSIISGGGSAAGVAA